MYFESTFSSAAIHPGEADILATVATNLCDQTAMLVYADWLEERDDPAGPFLRRYVQAVQSNNELPPLSEASIGLMRHSSPWSLLIGYKLVTQLRTLNLEQHTPSILQLAKPAVAIDVDQRTERELRVDATKFGGLPRLPKGIDWPRCEEGPLEFLTQLNLAEMRDTVAERAFPTNGLLSFFMYHNYPDDVYGVGRRKNPIEGGLQILYSPPDADLWPVPIPDDLTEDLGAPHTPHSLHITDFLDLPSRPEPWGTQVPADAIDQLWELRSDLQPRHQLLGYSHVTVLCNDPTPGPEWQQLIRFSSDHELKWGWGDGHRLFWYIRSDLRNMRFDRTVAIDG